MYFALELLKSDKRESMMLIRVEDNDFELSETQKYELLNAVADTTTDAGTIELEFYRNQLDDLMVKCKDEAQTIATIKHVAWRA